jgi:shikimate 5-dehydrogenase
VVTGRRMLLHQGVAAQRLFTGREPDLDAMSAALG